MALGDIDDLDTGEAAPRLCCDRFDFRARTDQHGHDNAMRRCFQRTLQ
jgi:hypothetical protein